MKYKSKIQKSRTKILGHFRTRMGSVRGHCGSYSTFRYKPKYYLKIFPMIHFINISNSRNDHFLNKKWMKFDKCHRSPKLIYLRIKYNKYERYYWKLAACDAAAA